MFPGDGGGLPWITRRQGRGKGTFREKVGGIKSRVTMSLQLQIHKQRSVFLPTSWLCECLQCSLTSAWSPSSQTGPWETWAFPTSASARTSSVLPLLSSTLCPCWRYRASLCLDPLWRELSLWNSSWRSFVMFSIRKPFHKYKNSKMLIIYFAVQKIKTNIWILKYSLYSSMAFIF